MAFEGIRTYLVFKEKPQSNLTEDASIPQKVTSLAFSLYKYVLLANVDSSYIQRPHTRTHSRTHLHTLAQKTTTK